MAGKGWNKVSIMKKPRAVLFDAYGTLFDVYSIALLAEQLFPGQGQRLALLWRDKQIEYTRLITTSNHGAHYQPFWTLTDAAIRGKVTPLARALVLERLALRPESRVNIAFARRAGLRAH